MSTYNNLYTNEQNEFIVDNYVKGGMTIAQLSKLFCRTESSVSHQVKNLGIIKEPHKQWTEDEVEYLHLHYKGDCQHVLQLAHKMNRTKDSIEGKANSLGLMRNKRPFWSEDEIELLKDNVGEYNVAKLANMVHRSVNSTLIKIKALKLHRKNRNGWYTTSEAGQIMGCSRNHVLSLIKRNKLYATNHYEDEGRNIRKITREALKNFICKHHGELQGRNVDMVQLVDVISANGVTYKHGKD